MLKRIHMHTYIHVYLQLFLNVYTGGNTVHSCSFCLPIFPQHTRAGGSVPDTYSGCAHEAPEFFCMERVRAFRPLVGRDGYAPPSPPLSPFSLLSLALSSLWLDLACRGSISRFLFLDNRVCSFAQREHSGFIVRPLFRL